MTNFVPVSKIFLYGDSFFSFFITLSLVSSGMQSAEQADSIAEVVEVLVADSVADSSVVPISDAVVGPDSPFASQPSIKPAVDYYRFRWPRTIAPGVMIAAGSVGVNCFIGFKGGNQGPILRSCAVTVISISTTISSTFPQ